MIYRLSQRFWFDPLQTLHRGIDETNFRRIQVNDDAEILLRGLAANNDTRVRLEHQCPMWWKALGAPDQGTCVASSQALRGADEKRMRGLRRARI